MPPPITLMPISQRIVSLMVRPIVPPSRLVPGLPDGMAISSDGHVFATGPGGVLVFDAVGKRLGRIETGKAVSNCAFGDDGHMLYLSSHSLVARIPVKALGLGFPR